jgi:hypothetical protein
LRPRVGGTVKFAVGVMPLAVIFIAPSANACVPRGTNRDYHPYSALSVKALRPRVGGTVKFAVGVMLFVNS